MGKSSLGASLWAAVGRVDAVGVSTLGGRSCLTDLCVLWTGGVEGVCSLVVSENHTIPTYCSTFLLSHFP